MSTFYASQGLINIACTVSQLKVSQFYFIKVRQKE